MGALQLFRRRPHHTDEMIGIVSFRSGCHCPLYLVCYVCLELSIRVLPLLPIFCTLFLLLLYFQVGTQRYMAPERLKGRPATPQSDLWSLGLTLATAALGENPICKASSEFEQTELADRAEKTIKKETSLSGGLADFLGKCLARNHTRRPALCELMQHEFLKQKEDWASKCPEVARAMRDRKRKQREDASALSTEAVLDALCQARAEDNIMGARSRVDTTTAADLAYELGVTSKSLVKRVRQRTQQLIRKSTGASACACSVHAAGRPSGGGGGGEDGGVVLSGGSCYDTSSSDRFICIEGDGLDVSPGGGSAPFGCGLLPMASRPFTQALSSAPVAQKPGKLLESTAAKITAAPVATVSSVPDHLAPALHPAAPATVTSTPEIGGVNTAAVAVQTTEDMAGITPRWVGGVHAPVPHEPGRVPRRKPMEVSSRVTLTPHKRRGERERRASRARASDAPGRDRRSRRSKSRHPRRRHRDEESGGSHCGHGPFGGSGSAASGGSGGGGRDRDRRTSSKQTEEVPRTAVSRMLPSRSKLLRSTRHVFQLADKMKTDLKVKDRIHRLRVYQECFSGREAVQWMLTNGHASSVNEAERLGNEMMKNGVFEHISNSHLFEDSSVLYRFSDGQELPPPASGGRRIGQMARVVFQSLVNGVLGGKDEDDFEVQISEIVLGTVSEPPERTDPGSRADTYYRGTASEGNTIFPKKGAVGGGSDFPTSAPSTVSSGPLLSSANVGGADKDAVDVRVYSSAPGGDPTLPDVKPPTLPSRLDRKSRRRQSSGVRLGNIRRFNSSVSATTMPETPTPF